MTTTLSALIALRPAPKDRSLCHRVKVAWPIRTFGHERLVSFEVVERVGMGSSAGSIIGERAKKALRSLAFETFPPEAVRISHPLNNGELIVVPSYDGASNTPSLLWWNGDERSRSGFATPDVLFSGTLGLDDFVAVALRLGLACEWSQHLLRYVLSCPDVDAMTKLRLAARWAEGDVTDGG